MRLHSYLNSAVKILGEYEGEQPFSAFLKKYFSANKKFGSRDRKQIAHLCYSFFRLGKALRHVAIEERILIGLFLCATETNEMLETFKPEWNSRVNLTVSEKLAIIDNDSSFINGVFPWETELSGGTDYEKFCMSFFIQPALFMRIRPGHEQEVKSKIHDANIPFGEIDLRCLSLPVATKIEDIIDLDKEAIVQDYNSQRTGEYMKPAIRDLKSRIKAWDCCAASGGKSLLLYDLIPNVDLTVSDIRTSILVNLKRRFAKAGIKKYRAFVTDLSNLHSTLTYRSLSGDHSPLTIHDSLFDLIICDAPCTGSGTWSRTPEQLFFFDESKIEYYASLQKKITANVIPHLGAGAFLVYITCSVFKKENEEVADFIKQQLHLELVEMELLKGYDKKADTMFIAVFKKAS